MVRIHSSGDSIVLLRGHDPLHPCNDPRVIKDSMSLSRAGMNPIVVCWSKRLTGLPEKDILPDGTPLIRIFHPMGPKDSNIAGRYLTFRRLQSILIDEVSRLRPKIIHCYDLEMLEAGVRIKRRIGAFLSFVALEHWPLMERRNSRLLYISSMLLERLLTRSVDLIITVNPYLQRYYQRFCPTVTVMNCAPTLWGDGVNNSDIMKIRRNLNLIGRFTVMHHGNLNDFKGLGKLVEVARIFKQRKFHQHRSALACKDIIFVALGPCETKNRLVTELKKEGLDTCFKILDPVSFEDLPVFIKAADVNSGVMTPAHMNLIATPVKTLEAMNCGVPVQVNSECSFVSEMVREEGCGVVCPFDAEQMVKSILWMMEHPDVLKKMGKAGRRAAERRYNWEGEARKMIELYGAVINRNDFSMTFHSSVMGRDRRVTLREHNSLTTGN